MANIKFIAVSRSLSGIMDYVTNREKTVERLISGVNCVAQTAQDEFEAVKKQFHKTDGRSYYHIVQAFAPDDPLDFDTAHEIGLKFAEYFKGYQCVVVTHMNTAHIHNHIIMNSVNFETGQKFHQSAREMQQAKEYSNQLCREYGLSFTESKADSFRIPAWKKRLCRTIKEAMENCATREEFIAFMAEYRDVELTEDSRMTLGEWLDRWLTEYKAGTVRPGTLKSYRCYIEYYIKPQLGDKQISLISQQDIQRMYRRLKTEGRIHEHPEMNHQLSDSMVRHIHSTLHAALKDAVQAHVIPRNPTEGTTAPKPNYKPKRILTGEELDAFRAVVERDEVWRDFFQTELMTGLRRGEICGLQWSDFDGDTGTLKVCRTLHSQRKGEYTTGETKTNQGMRTIILPHSVTEILRRRKADAISQWIFPDPVKPEDPVDPNAAYRHMKTLLQRAGLPSIRFHDLRHTFATHALTSGVDAKTLSGILGHTNASFTLDSAAGGRFRAGAGNCPGPGGKAENDRFQALCGPQAQIRHRLCHRNQRPSL